MRYTVLFLLVSFLGVHTSVAQEIQPNELREQGNSLHWNGIESHNFRLYYIAHHEQLARNVLPKLNRALYQIEEKINYRLSGQIEIYLYPSPGQLNSSYQDQPFTSDRRISGGIADVTSFKVAVAFRGDNQRLLNELKSAISLNLIREMLYGGTAQERIKYSALLDLPTWFESGLAQHLADEWTFKDDNALRDITLRHPKFRIEQMSDRDKLIVGKSLWKFMSERKGDLTSARMLYLIRLTRKVEAAFYFVFGVSSRELFGEWEDEVRRYYATDLRRRIPQDGLFDQKLSAFDWISTIDCPQEDVYLITGGLKGKHVLAKIGGNGNLSIIREDPEFYSSKTINEKAFLTCQNPGSGIYLIDNSSSRVVLYELSTNGREIDQYDCPFEYVVDLEYDPSGKRLVVSAVLNGQTDIFSFSILRQQWDQLTDDLIDESDVSCDEYGNIFYTGLRDNQKTDPENRNYNKDLFSLVQADGIVEPSNMTRTDEIDEGYPIKLSGQKLTFLSNKNGITNAYLLDIDQNQYSLTDYRFNIQSVELSPNKEAFVELLKINGSYRLFKTEVDLEADQFVDLPSNTALRNLLEDQKMEKAAEKEDKSSEAVEADEALFFQTDFRPPSNIDSIEYRQTEEDAEKLVLRKLPKSDINLGITRIYSQMDNSFFTTDRFSSALPLEDVLYNRFGLVGGVALSDQFNKHELEGLFRFDLNFNRYQFLLNYRDRSGELAKGLQLWRDGILLQSDENFYRKNSSAVSLYLATKLKKNVLLSANSSVRRDEVVPLSTGESTLSLRSTDRSVFIETIGLDVQKQSKSSLGLNKNFLHFEFELIAGGKGKFGGNLSADHRYKQYLAHGLSLNTRLRGSVSRGDLKTLYVMGGTEQEVFKRFSDATILGGNIFYQGVFGIRGFNRNTRNGNTFISSNIELEYELKHLNIGSPIRISFLERSSIRIFGDLGSAWYGTNPWNKQNPTNRTEIRDGNIQIVLFQIKDPLIYSMGTGFTTDIYGYSLRYDLAYGYDNGVWNRARSHISLGKSF